MVLGEGWSAVRIPVVQITEKDGNPSRRNKGILNIPRILPAF